MRRLIRALRTVRDVLFPPSNLPWYDWSLAVVPDDDLVEELERREALRRRSSDGQVIRGPDRWFDRQVRS